MFVVKLQYRSEIRRVAVVDPIKYDRLKQLANELFSTTSLPETFLFQYKDSEGDDVSVSSERELEEAIRIVQNNNPAILKLEIKSQQKSSCGECCFQKFFEHCRKGSNQCGQQRGQCCSKKFLLIPLIGLLLVFKPCLLWCLGLIALAVCGICAAKRHFACDDRKRKCGRGSCWTQSSSGSQCPLANWCSSTVAPKSIDVNTVPKSEEVLNKETADTSFEGKQEQEYEQEYEQEHEKVNSPFESKLKQLEEMGFSDRTANIELLIKHGGNLLKSVKALLEKTN